MIIFADEAPRDIAAREDLLDRALGPGRRLKSSERIRSGRLPADGLSLVARDGDDRLVGTVRLWNVSAGRGRPALLLGPLAIDQAVRGSGVGAALMRLALSRADERGHGAVVLVGDAHYYARFGFSAGAAAGLAMPGPFERHRLLGLELRAGQLVGASGLIRPAGVSVDVAGETAAALAA
jgi:predicted N-acetyltransferase YhbS